MKKSLTLLAFVLCSWISAMAQFSGSGSGTSGDPYKIYYADQLNQVRNFLSTSGVYFKLMNDIDLESWISENYPTQGWQPIGSSSAPFQGVFDGNGKKLTNFSITRSSTDYVGFFAYTSGATIKNLTIEGSVKGKQYTGSLIGYGINTNVSSYTFNGALAASGSHGGGVAGYITSGTASSLNVNATITGTSYLGGLFGQGSGTVSTATVASSVKGTSFNVGGAIGYSAGITLSNCTITAPVTGTYNTGGIIGYITGTSSIQSSKQTGKISGSYNIGGILGSSTAKTTVSNSKHAGDITGTYNIGGTIGSANSCAITLTSCYSDGNITGTGTGYIGGIVGYMENLSTSTISKCCSWGDISGKSFVGGIVGYNKRALSTINYTSKIQTYNKSAVSDTYATVLWSYIFESTNAATSGSGAFYSNSSHPLHEWYTGENGNIYINLLTNKKNDSNMSIEGCSAVGSLSNTGAYSGGIIGKDEWGCVNTVTESHTYYYYPLNSTSVISQTFKKYTQTYSYTNISNSYFSGSITGTTYVGGIAGYKNGGVVESNYSNAIISGTDYIGGLVGKLEKSNDDTGTNAFNSNVAVNTSVSATESNAGRIYGASEGNFTMATLGTNKENRSIATTVLYKNGVAQTLSDNLQNGTAVGISQLRYKANYVAWGWDFNNNWTIQDTETFPYKVWQTAPPTFDAIPASGATSISGKSIDGGNVTVITADANQSYTTTANNNTWAVNFSSGLNTNEVVKAYAQKNGLEKSYISTTTAGVIGSGTPEDPYLIHTAYDLAAISKEGNYKLMNDIDLTSWINENSPTTGWPGVGISSVSDSLVFEGDGHKITGLWSTSTSEYTGLFTRIPGSNSVIRNLELENVNMNSNNSSGCVAGLVGSCNGKIENCSVTGSVKGNSMYAGLLVGYIINSFSNCNVSGTVEGTYNYAGLLAGELAISGKNCADCTADGTITGYAIYMGGLIGKSLSSINNCSVDATVSNSAAGMVQYTGGLCGEETEHIYQCIASGTITGRHYTGGLAGKSNGVVQKSISTGSVSGLRYVGGIAGYASTVINCYSTSDVTSTATNSYAGGIAGYATSNIDYCYASGDITSANVVAGIVGYLNGSAAKVRKCVAINDIISTNSESGFAMRVIGGYTNGAADPEQNSLAYKNMAVSINNVAQRVYDDPLNGTATEMSDLKTQSTYTGLGWDFTSVWYMNGATGYPDFIWNKSKTHQTISLTSIPTLNYGDGLYTLPAVTDQDQTLTWNCSQANVATVSGNVLTIEGAGTALVTATQEGNANYYDFSKSYVLTVNKALLTISAVSQNKQEGEANPELTASYSGFVNGDDESSLTALPTLETSATDNSPIGTYPIIVYGAAADNYDIMYVNGTLTIVDESALNNRIEVTSLAMSPDSETQVSINLENESPIIMAEFYMQLPEGFEIAVDEDGYYVADLNSSRNNKHSLEVERASNGIYHFLCFSSRNNTLKGNSGELINLTLVCDNDVESGTYTGRITNILLSDDNTHAIEPADVSFEIEVSDYTPGDVNGDGRVNGLDIVEMVDKIMGRPSDSFIFKAGDFDSNGVINGMDLVEEVSLVMSQTISGVKARKAQGRIHEDILSKVQLSKNDTGALSIGMDNDEGYILSQFVLELDEGQTLKNIKAGDERHIVAYRQVDNNRYTVVCYSMRNDLFEENTGMVDISYEGTGAVRVSNMMLVDSKRQPQWVGDAKFDEATGINLVDGTFAVPTDIYSISGVLVRKNATNAKGLGKGIYVTNGKTIIIK